MKINLDKNLDKKNKVIYQLYVSQPQLEALKKHSPKIKNQSRSKSYKIIKVINKALLKSIDQVKKQIYGHKDIPQPTQQRSSSRNLQNHLEATLQRRLDLKLQEQQQKIERIRYSSLKKQLQLKRKRLQTEKQKYMQEKTRKRQMQLMNSERERGHYLSRSRRKSESSEILSMHKDSIDMKKTLRLKSSKSEKIMVERSFKETERNHRFIQLKSSLEKKQQRYQHEFKKAFLLNQKFPKKRDTVMMQKNAFQKEEKKMAKNQSKDTQKLPKISIQNKKLHVTNIGKTLIDKKISKSNRQSLNKIPTSKNPSVKVKKQKINPEQQIKGAQNPKQIKINYEPQEIKIEQQQIKKDDQEIIIQKSIHQKESSMKHNQIQQIQVENNVAK